MVTGVTILNTSHKMDILYFMEEVTHSLYTTTNWTFDDKLYRSPQ